MTTDHSIPPLRDLPPGRLDDRRQHLRLKSLHGRSGACHCRPSRGRVGGLPRSRLQAPALLPELQHWRSLRTAGRVAHTAPSSFNRFTDLPGLLPVALTARTPRRCSSGAMAP